MFSIYSYELDKNLFGVCIDKDLIDIGDIDKINSYRFINVDFINGYDNKHLLAFDSFIDYDSIKLICDLFNNELLKNEKITIEKIINNIAGIFSKYRQDNIFKRYIGLFSELIFIHKLQENNIDITRYYQFDHELYDFSLENVFLEVKTVNKISSSIKLNAYQIDNLYSNNVEIICVNLLSSQHNGKNLNELFSMIKFDNIEHKKIVQDEITNIFNSNPDIFDHEKFLIDESYIEIFDKSILPKYNFANELINSKSFVNATFELKVSKSYKNVVDAIKGYMYDKN